LIDKQLGLTRADDGTDRSKQKNHKCLHGTCCEQLQLVPMQ